MLRLLVGLIRCLGVEVSHGHVGVACLVTRGHEPHGVDAVAYARVLQRVELEAVIPMQRLAHLLPLIAELVDIGLFSARPQILTEQVVLIGCPFEGPQRHHQAHHLVVQSHGLRLAVLRYLSPHRHRLVLDRDVAQPDVPELLGPDVRIVHHHAAQQEPGVLLLKILLQLLQLAVRQRVAVFLLFPQHADVLDGVHRQELPVHQPCPKC